MKISDLGLNQVLGKRTSASVATKDLDPYPEIGILVDQPSSDTPDLGQVSERESKGKKRRMGANVLPFFFLLDANI